MKKSSDYLQRQLYFVSNLGLFYVIIIALFAIPMIGAFVAVFIKGVIDFKYAIIFGGAAMAIVIAYFLCKLMIRLYRKFRKDGVSAHQEFRDILGRGEPVQISLLDGLVTVSGGGNSQPMKLVPILNDPGSAGAQQIPLLSQPPESKNSASSVINQLKDLSDLKEKEIISEDEFQTLKKKLMEEMNEK